VILCLSKCFCEQYVILCLWTTELYVILCLWTTELYVIISSGSRTTADNGYQQQVICSGSEITTDDSVEPLQMTFSVVVLKW
jgi:hypothetical protein